MRRLARRPRPDDEGVASTVGTLMALLVFLTFFGLIINQYVPAWMNESESSHVNTVLGQFGALKGSIDLQNVEAQVGGSDYVPVTAASAVTLGVEAVPIFAVPTVGTLFSDPDAAPFTVTFDYLIQTPTGGDFPARVREQSNGSVVLEARNRYHVPEAVAYVNGAVVRAQRDGQVVRAQPTFLVTETNRTLTIWFDLVSLYGRGGVTGTGTEIVNSRLFATDLQVYDRFPGNGVIWINHTSAYGLAWYQFLNGTLADSLKSLRPGGTYTWTPLDQGFTARLGATVVYKVTVSFVPTTGLYITRLEIHNNPGVLSLDRVRLRHAQVQVGIGSAPENALR